MKTENVWNVMKQMMLTCLSLSVLLCVVTSCRQLLDQPPVLVSEPVSGLSSVHGTFHHAGISFECSNIGSKEIVSIEVSFLVFISRDGGNPFYGSNVVTAEVSSDLASGASGLFEISLDDRLAYIPAAPFFIDCFYVREVTFSDGTAWTDPLGLYYAGSLPS